MTDQNSLWGPVTRLLDRACTYHSDRTALIAGDRSLTYTEPRSATTRIANGLLALGITPGERVGPLMPHTLEFVPTQYGIWKSGAVPVQMAAKASADDHRYFLTESGT
ncbi:AMP-binding protein [Nocardia sp. NBC_01388]|uniref:AMP-binding protein n=1 Tax=Nocardia sp. NBC_01388 TaxID=2903596 RepID=UPI0032478B5F